MPMLTGNSTEIIGYDTTNITWVRTDFVKAANAVEVTVAGDNAYLFGDGKIKLKVRIVLVFFFISFHRLQSHDCVEPR